MKEDHREKRLVQANCLDEQLFKLVDQKRLVVRAGDDRDGCERRDMTDCAGRRCAVEVLPTLEVVVAGRACAVVVPNDALRIVGRRLRRLPEAATVRRRRRSAPF